MEFKCIFFCINLLIHFSGGRCVNTPGSFKCSCASGYQGSGRQCVATKCSSTFKIWSGTEIDSCDAKTCTMKCSEGYTHESGEYLQTCDWRGKWPSSTQLKCEGIKSIQISI